ncbi:hypothetical protein KP509_24G058600 [Ceratopteris richardii]|uniref:Protein phosphatase n=1 Tax=Ceratopteris richardii TaxID=49495 RepID=A0A8T2RXS1_CERRI|nr:hypothetical protein KP509_24G058600 [Ceratopteris richardii]
MPVIHQLLKSANAQPGIKGKLKGLFGKSNSLPLYSKLGQKDPLASPWLPSSSFRSFQCEISKLSNRTREVNDSEKPLTVSDAVSRVFSTPSVHGPKWQALSYHTHQILDENSVRSPHDSVHFASAILQCKVSGTRPAKLEASFVFPLESELEKAVFGVSVSPRIWRESKRVTWQDHSKIVTLKQMETEDILEYDWSHEIEEVGESKEAENSEMHAFNLPSTFTEFYSFFSELCGSNLGDSFRSLMYEFQGIKQGRVLSDISPEFPVVEDLSVASKSLKLLSAACYFPHPEKELTGGEDAYFICPEKQVIGVADGVGGWAEMGIDSGEYARKLMNESFIAAQEEPSGSVDAARVLKKAYFKTTCRGSSTACILALSDFGLQAVNLGDSGFIVVRNGRTIFKSPSQQHNFNFPFQLESFGGGDPLSAAELFVVDVAAEDVIIVGTDGLFDNLFATEIEALVLQAKWSDMSPDVTAQKIADLAREHANDCNRQTPFSRAAQSAGYSYYGGKMDDITVIVSYVTNHLVI